jgi:hypothetical protein
MRGSNLINYPSNGMYCGNHNLTLAHGLPINAQSNIITSIETQLRIHIPSAVRRVSLKILWKLLGDRRASSLRRWTLSNQHFQNFRHGVRTWASAWLGHGRGSKSIQLRRAVPCSYTGQHLKLERHCYLRFATSFSRFILRCFSDYNCAKRVG